MDADVYKYSHIYIDIHVRAFLVDMGTIYGMLCCGDTPSGQNMYAVSLSPNKCMSQLYSLIMWRNTRVVTETHPSNFKYSNISSWTMNLISESSYVPP